ncbi:MAG: energy-coupling factor ABC transporter permease [bacterium]
MKKILLGLLVMLALMPQSAFAMHITEGILPPLWAGLWFVLVAPFFIWGLREIKAKSINDPRYKSMVALIGAAVFIISCMPVPVPLVGTCSHPAGTGLAAIIIGPAPTVVLSSVALTLQALFLAHGGLTTLGANLFSMGVAGAFAAYGVFLLARILRVPIFWAAFAAGLTSDWATYALTSIELASALKGEHAFVNVFYTILAAFSPTQIPLGILEGFLTAIAYQFFCSKLKLPGTAPWHSENVSSTSKK